MAPQRFHTVKIPIDDPQRVSGLFCAPAIARACYVLAHRAGGGKRRHEAEGRRQKAEGRRQKAEGRRQKDSDVGAVLLHELAAWIEAVIQAGHLRR
jgi:hypothetical protein